MIFDKRQWKHQIIEKITYPSSEDIRNEANTLSIRHVIGICKASRPTNFRESNDNIDSKEEMQHIHTLRERDSLVYNASSSLNEIILVSPVN
ncbi:unnamed protein product [Schistosoma margrebowiei]|uniref:Uncharacterized protein n=1 Tax=Schistosoma margrebowiei TaxID=48269 RepID=A0A183N9E6_9TREM|nr:unnamed protein product [Schistosoma margrebowiei]